MIAAAALALGVAFEALALGALAAGAAGAALALHLAAAGAIAEAFWARRRADHPRLLATAWFCVALFPLFGTLAALALVASLSATAPEPGESWEERRRRAAADALAGKQRAQQLGPELVPLVDALRARDVNLRVAAVDALRDARTRRHVQLLARQRDNDAYEVRFRAAEALGRISARRLDEIAVAVRELEHAPDRAATHRRVATLAFQYAELGVDSVEVSCAYFERAVTHGNLALRASKRFDVDLMLLIARAWWRLGEIAQALEAHRRILEIAPRNVAALSSLAELQFERRDFAALRATCERLQRAGARPDDEGLAHAIELFTGHDTDVVCQWSSA